MSTVWIPDQQRSQPPVVGSKATGGASSSRGLGLNEIELTHLYVRNTS